MFDRERVNNEARSISNAASREQPKPRTRLNRDPRGLARLCRILPWADWRRGAWLASRARVKKRGWPIACDCAQAGFASTNNCPAREKGHDEGWSRPALESWTCSTAEREQLGFRLGSSLRWNHGCLRGRGDVHVSIGHLGRTGNYRPASDPKLDAPCRGHKGVLALRPGMTSKSLLLISFRHLV